MGISINDVKKKAQPIVDVHKKVVDPLGISDKLFGPGVTRPDTGGYEAARAKVLEDLAAGIPAEYVAEKYAGDFTPEQVAEIAQQGDSELKKIQIDPALRANQKAALAALQERMDGGYSIEDKAAISRALNEASLQERAQRDALMANAQARGVAGGGTALAQQLMAQQGAASNASQSALDIAAEGRRRALEAAMQSGQLAGNIRSQDFGEQAKIAAAQDAINQFNTNNLNTQTYYNNGVVNDARLRNVDTRQGVNARNATSQNQFNQNKFNNQAKVGEMNYNHQTNEMNRTLAEYAAKVAARNKQRSGILTAGGAIGGAVLGGPAGAKVGATVGQGVGGAMEEEQ